MSKLREFEGSPSAQLFWENLATRGIFRQASHETVYRSNWFSVLEGSFVQLFWVYFPAPVDEAQMARIEKLRGIRPTAMGFSVPRSEIRQIHVPGKIWANQTEVFSDQEAQLMLWPHFWRNEEKAEYRNFRTSLFAPGSSTMIIGSQTVMEEFARKLEETGPIGWKEEFCKFTCFPLI